MYADAVVVRLLRLLVTSFTERSIKVPKNKVVASTFAATIASKQQYLYQNVSHVQLFT